MKSKPLQFLKDSIREYLHDFQLEKKIFLTTQKVSTIKKD